MFIRYAKGELPDQMMKRTRQIQIQNCSAVSLSFQDVCPSGHRVEPELHKLIFEATNLTFSTKRGQGVHESSPHHTVNSFGYGAQEKNPTIVAGCVHLALFVYETHQTSLILKGLCAPHKHLDQERVVQLGDQRGKLVMNTRRNRIEPSGTIGRSQPQ